ncbi:MAG TPA: LamG domain-containing protein [Candidatus Limnocylindria bacterium]|jgi:hypothetical protein|nr:LamG domain-containing protein [Candidatus Limnocylindria bacterium]
MKRRFSILFTSAVAVLLGITTAFSADYALNFEGGQAVETPVTGDKLAGDELTIEYWFKGSKMLSAVRIQDGSVAWLVAGWGGGNGTSGVTPVHLIKTSGSQDVRPNSSAMVQDGSNWHHLAVTYKRGAAKGIVSFVDGVAVDRRDAANEPIPAIAGKVWLGALNGTQEFMTGALDEVRLWKRALTEAEILSHAQNPRRLTGREQGLVAYFPFNETGTATTREVVSGQDAGLKGFTAAGRVSQTGIVFGPPLPDPAAAGLWLGEVSLNKVNEVAEGSASTTLPQPAGGQFDFNIILHADTNGIVRLLKDVSLMQKRNTASNLTEIVLITDDTLLANYDGVVKRAGKLVGVRYSSSFFPFAGQYLACTGGLGLGNGLLVTNTLPASLPTNPFRHLYHPNHKDPRDLQNKPYDIERRIEIVFNDVKLGVGEGRDSLKGTYRETILGLHKLPLITEGSVSLQRLSLVNKLNNQ